MSTLPTPLDRGRLRARISQGDVVIGTFIGLGAATAEVAAAAGVDFVVLDTEHGSLSDDVAGQVVLATGAYGVPTIVRVECGERIRVGRALDAGAAGIMLPRVEGASHAQELLKSLRYPPHGVRGVATYNRAVRWALDPDALDSASDEVLGIVQIETQGALAEIDAIAALDGADVLFVGPLDLSYALGVPRDFSAPVFQDALRAVVKAARRHGKSAGILGPSQLAAAQRQDEGFQFIAVGSDSTLLGSTLTSMLTKTRKRGRMTSTTFDSDASPADPQ